MMIENNIIKEYNNFIKTNSIFGDSLLVLPATPQSFSSFPTIIIKEANNVDNTSLKTLNNIEYGDDLTYQIDIYTKDIVIGTTKYASKTIINEIRELNHKFFRNCGFTRITDSRGEYIDYNVARQTQTYQATLNSWNKSIM